MNSDGNEKKRTGALFGRLGKLNAKFVLLIVVTFASLFALSAGTFAWFLTMTKNADISRVVSGDLNVDVKKVTAIKYVYPFYANSTQDIDYESPGVIKSYVIEDSRYEVENAVTITNIKLSTNYDGGTIAASAAAADGPRNIYYEGSQSFNYYLVGDGVFTGEANNIWSTLRAPAFIASTSVGGGNETTLKNVVVSAGANFILFDKTKRSEDTKYFDYSSTSTDPEADPFELPSGSCFKINTVKVGNSEYGVSLQCLKGGIYDFTYSEGNLKIELVGRDGHTDYIIGNGVFDPTKVKLDYDSNPIVDSEHDTHLQDVYGTVNNDGLNNYIPDAIKGQNTMVILDVELAYKNANDIIAALDIFRNAADANTVRNPSGDSSSHKYGYPDDELHASNFYSYHAVFAENSNKISGDSTHSEAENIYNELHVASASYTYNQGGSVSSVSPFFDKFVYGDEGDATSIRCATYLRSVSQGAPNTTEITALRIPSAVDNDGQLTESVYHCYIAIEYDYLFCRYFFNTDRMGNTYHLNRDFFFRFRGEQILASDQQSSGS